MVVAQILESIMLITFGCSWPINAWKSYKARTAVSTSWQFLLLITLGYLFGIAAKFVANDVTWVVAVYVINVVLLMFNWGIYFRNCKLDAQRIESAQIQSAVDKAHKIVIASDGSPAALQAAGFSAKAINLKGADNIVVLTVQDGSGQTAEQRAKEVLDSTEAVLNQNDVSCIKVVKKGQPAEQIVNYVSSSEADLLVVGSRGLSGVRKLMLGSVSSQVVNGVGCPVMVIK